MKTKRKPTEKQLAALKRGRAEMKRRRKAAKQSLSKSGGARKPKKRRAAAPKEETVAGKKKSKKRSSGGGKRRSSSGRRRRRSGGGGGKWGLTGKQVAIAIGAAGLFAYALKRTEDSDTAPGMKWFKDMPVVTPLGRAGTAAAAAGGLAYFNIKREWTKPIAVGLTVLGVASTIKRGGFYQTEAEARTLQLGGVSSGEVSSYLGADVDMSRERATPGNGHGQDFAAQLAAAYEKGQAEGARKGYETGVVEGARQTAAAIEGAPT